MASIVSDTPVHHHNAHMTLVHLHTHTEFSLLDGAIRVDDLCKKVAELGQGAVAITDHGWISGAIKFVKSAKDAGIKPIVGMETYLATNNNMKAPAKNAGDNFHLTLLARSAAGYKNMMRLSSLAFLEGMSYKPRIDFDTLSLHKEGIIVLSGCIGAQIPQAVIEGGYGAGKKLATQYRDTFGENFFIEVMNHGASRGVDHVKIADPDGEIRLTETDLNVALTDIADALGVGVVATNDAHYLEREHGQHHDTLLCIGMGAWKQKTDRMRFPGAGDKAWEFYIKSEEEMLRCSAEEWWTTACANTAHIAEMVDDSVVQLGVQSMPKYPIPTDDPEFTVWLARQK